MEGRDQRVDAVRDVRFAQGFVGVFSRERSEAPPTPVDGCLDVAVTRLTEGDHILDVVGNRHPTIPLSVESGIACIKGRPHRLGADASSLTIGGANVARELAALDGRFAVCVLAANRLVLATDILGASAVFYHYDPGCGLRFSTHLGFLIRSMPRTPALDALGVTGILAGSCMIGGRTPYEGVQRLKAGECLIAERHGPTLTYRVDRYLDLVDELIASPLDPVGEEASFESLILETVAREATSRDLGLMLSGGKDSQTLALTLLLLEHKTFRAFTFGEWRSADLRRAKRFAAALKIPHESIDYRRWTFETYADVVTQLAGGASGLQAAHHLVAYDRLRGRTSQAMLGFLGDALTGAHLPGSGQTRVDTVLPFRRSWHPELRRAYAPELAQLEVEIEQQWSDRPEIRASQRNQLTDLVIRQATWISSSFDLCDWFVPLSFPFFSRRLFRFWLNQTVESLTGQRLYSDWVARTFARLATDSGHTPPLGARVYETLQQLLDNFDSRTGRGPVVPVVNWQAKLKSSAKWLEQVAAHTTDERLRRVLPAQLKHRSGHYPALLAAGLACAVK